MYLNNYHYIQSNKALALQCQDFQQNQYAHHLYELRIL